MLLLGLALAAPLIAFRRARRDPLAAAALAVYIAALAHQAVDWDWELSGVTLTMILCGGALLAAARPDQRVRGRRIPTAVLAALVALAALFALAGNLAIAAASRDVSTGNFSGSASAARRAKLLAPWSATPWQLLGDAQLALGQQAKAEASLEKAVSMSNRDWTLWLDLARASHGAARTHAIDTAQRLDPLDHTITTFGRDLARKRRS
jgi:tetratricopeptide (TPR) repeat protein